MNIEQIRRFFKEDYPRLHLLTGNRAGQIDLNNIPAINVDDDSKFGRCQTAYSLSNMTIAKLENTAVHPYKQLIMERFFNNRTPPELETIIGYGHTATNYKMNEALTSFATEYNKLADKYNFEFKFQ